MLTQLEQLCRSKFILWKVWEGKASHDDVAHRALFQKAQKLVGIEGRIGSHRAQAVLLTQQIKGFAQKLFRPLAAPVLPLRNQIDF
jgi:hypothetical protein